MALAPLTIDSIDDPRAERIAVLPGSEDRGLDPATLRHGDVPAAIPMSEPKRGHRRRRAPL